MTGCNAVEYLNWGIILDNGNIGDLISVSGIQIISRYPEDAKELASQNSLNEIVLGSYGGLKLKCVIPALLMLKCYTLQLNAID